ncbi:DUF3757 domain-containing protein [Xanthomonas populi]|uniref:DUF3757 domain-containing protein n=1 Tax=Xanthomonas populi TaxID=53414 RepID=A0A2S7ERW6_9XANT|nr:DUF3757 domain-containing protein [Xanthomonas populi]PPU95862.1 hypothetical protein XpopCFBP1817_07820 [Xanthomonas populi]
MKHPLSTVIFFGMLMLSLQPSTAFGQEHSPQSAKCPEPAAVHYDAAHYRAVADVEFSAGSGAYGRGDWVSTKQPDQGVPIKLSSVLFYGKQPGKSKTESESEGTLVNCTYELRNHKQVDLAYFDRSTPNQQRNLIVVPKRPSRWQLDQKTPAPTLDAFYSCTQSAKDCAFEPRRLE